VTEPFAPEKTMIIFGVVCRTPGLSRVMGPTQWDRPRVT